MGGSSENRKFLDMHFFLIQFALEHCMKHYGTLNSKLKIQKCGGKKHNLDLLELKK